MREKNHPSQNNEGIKLHHSFFWWNEEVSGATSLQKFESMNKKSIPKKNLIYWFYEPVHSEIII